MNLKHQIPHLAWTLAAVALAAAGPLVAATPTLIWSDEFSQGDAADHTAPDSTKWSYELGNNSGWGNNELESYTNSRTNSYIAADADATDGKALVIAAVKDSQGNYTSARIKTQNKFTASYGHFEARLKVTSGKGLWPAFWMLGANIGTGTPWPNCGEIDIMEVTNASPATAYGTAHGPGYSGANGIGGSSTLASGSYDQAYHVFSVDWSPGQIVWAVDGKPYKTLTSAQIPSGTSWVFDNSPFFILLNLAVGGYWPGNPDGTTMFPAKYSVDYVRVYGLPPVAPVPGTASAPTSGQVNISWSAPTDLKGFALTGYLIERSTNASFSANLIPTSVGLVTGFADTTVAGGTTYYYRVSAVSTGGTSDPSASLSATTPPSLVAPAFTLQPAASQTVLAGASVTFTAAASGNPAPTYQWRKNGVNINGATSPSLGLVGVTTADAATYTVVATNSVTSVTSAPAVLTVTPRLAGDFDGDGHPDLLWTDSATGERRIGLLNGTTLGAQVPLGTVPSDWAIAGTADFNGDGLQDIVWSNTATGERIVWLMGPSGSYASSASLGVVPVEWSIVGTGDFNGDGHVDLAWQDKLTGECALWLMSGTTFESSVSLGVFPRNMWVGGAADFNGDGSPDLLFVDTRSGGVFVLSMNGTVPFMWVQVTSALGANISELPGSGIVNVWLGHQPPMLAPVGAQISGLEDLNGDGQADILWTNSLTGARFVWLLSGGAVANVVPIATVPLEWILNAPSLARVVSQARGDFNADGNSDILWQNTLTGDRVVWLMSGTAFASGVDLGTVSTDWSVASIGDFNGDGKADLLWQNTSTGERLIWLMDGTTYLSSVSLGGVATAWSIAGAGDFNGDGQTDILWQNSSTGERYLWLMNGTAFSSAVSLGVISTDWTLVGAADFNGDGQPDLLWQNTSTGERYVWLMNGTAFSSAVSLGVISTDWKIAGTGDFNGDGQTDLVWQNTVTGERYVWLMNGTTFSSSVFLGVIPTDWSIQD